MDVKGKLLYCYITLPPAPLLFLFRSLEIRSNFFFVGIWYLVFGISVARSLVAGSGWQRAMNNNTKEGRREEGDTHTTQAKQQRAANIIVASWLWRGGVVAWCVVIIMLIISKGGHVLAKRS